MNVEVGWTYKFSFIKDFQSLDNVYTLVRIYTYAEILEDSINLAEVLYSLVGKTQEEYEQDANAYKSQRIFKLQHPTVTDTIIYVPASLVAEVPNPFVKQYAKLVVAVNIGVYPNDEELNHVKDVLHQQLAAQLGFADNPDVFSVSHVWLTEEEYNSVVADRENTAKTIINYFSENRKLQKELDQAKERVKQYEEYIAQIASLPSSNPKE